MEIKVLPLGIIQSNCYLLSTDNAVVVIDPGFNNDCVTQFLKENTNKERLILLTHAHFDHIGGALNLRKDTNTKIAIGRFDNPALGDTAYSLSDKFHAKLEPFYADILLDDEDEFNVGDISFKVLYTPGHTKGSVCYLTGDLLFSGDTLFQQNIGRTDFPGGNFDTLEKSVKRLYSLNQNITVLAGHGDKTTIEHERKFNPFIRG